MESEAPYPRFTTVVPQPGGWVLLRVFGPVGTSHPPFLTDSPPAAVLVKTAERDGRRVITALVVVAEQISSTVIKALPLGRIESLLNTPRIREAIEAAGPRDQALDALLETEVERLSAEPGLAPEQRPLVAPAPREPLRRPDRSDPEGFYRRVADAYNEAVTRTSAPATVLAAEADVPVPTARRWIAEARRRGLLPVGRKGRAG